MSLLYDDGASDNLLGGGGGLAAPPLTIAGWFNTDDSSAYRSIASLADSGSDKNYFSLTITPAGDGTSLIANTRDSGSSPFARSTSSYSLNTWHHGCFVSSAANSRSIYLDGGNSATDSNSATPTGIDNTGMGFLPRATGTSYWSGMLAEVAIWSAALTAAEAAWLATAASPLTLSHRIANLVHYQPMVRTLNLSGFGTMAVTGTAVAAHPRVIYPCGFHTGPNAALVRKPWYYYAQERIVA